MSSIIEKPYYNSDHSFHKALLQQINFRGNSFKNLKEMFVRYCKRQTLFRKIFSLGSVKKRGNISVFAVRNNALELGILNLITKIIELYGFKILAKKVIEKERIDYVSKKTRGSNWVPGKQAEGAKGFPEAIIVAFDPNPINIPKRMYKLYPELDNGRLFVKRKLRTILNTFLPSKFHANFLHVTDYENQAWRYIRIMIPKSESIIRSKIEFDFKRCKECGPNIFMEYKDGLFICRKCNNSEQRFPTKKSSNKNKIYDYVYNYSKFIYLSIWWIYKVKIQRLKRALRNTNVYKNPFKSQINTYQIETELIRYLYSQDKDSYKLRKFDIDLVFDGDWAAPTSDQKFEKSLVYKSLFERFVEKKAWFETDYFKNRVTSISKENNITKVVERFRRLDNLYYDMQKNGYLSQKELSSPFPSAKALQGWGEIAIHIGQNGELYLCQGRHRLALAKILDIPKIRVNIIVRHNGWINFKKEIMDYLNEQNVNFPIKHVDLESIPSHFSDDDFHILINNLSKYKGEVLVLGAHWGYFCNALDNSGFRPVAVEDNPKDLYFLKKFKLIFDKKYLLIEDYRKLLNSHEQVEYDAILAIDTLHKFWRNNETLELFASLLKSVNARCMFFQHALTEEKQVIANQKVSSDEVINFIMKNSHFSKNTKLGNSSTGIPIFKFEV